MSDLDADIFERQLAGRRRGTSEAVAVAVVRIRDEGAKFGLVNDEVPVHMKHGGFEDNVNPVAAEGTWAVVSLMDKFVKSEAGPA